MRNINTQEYGDEVLKRKHLSRLAAIAGALVLFAACSGKTEDSERPLPQASTPTLTESVVQGSSTEEADKATETLEEAGEFASTPSWEQDFSTMEDGPIDKTKWTYELNPEVPTWNNEQQAYTNKQKNVRIENDMLVIEAHKEPYVYPNDTEKRKYNYTSGRIDTRNSLTAEYGKFEATMQLPAEQGNWAAFWMLSANQVHTAKKNPTDAKWAQPRFYMNDGELDIMESYGRFPGVIEATLYTYSKTYEDQTTVKDYSTKFHTYGVELTPNKIVWTIDGKPYSSVTKPSNKSEDWPFQGGNRMYMILNLALGGDGGGPIDPNIKSQKMLVKNVRFYAYQGN